MTNYQTHTYRMLLSVTDYLAKQSRVIAVIPAFVRSLSRLQARLKEIEDIDSGKKKITSGKSEAKANLKKELVEQTLNIAGALSTYASENDIIELKARTNFSEWDLKKKKDTELTATAKTIYDDAVSFISQLTDYGIAQEAIDLLNELTNDFHTSISETGTTKNKKTGATKALFIAFGEARAILENEIDKHANTLKMDNPDFYNGYKAARTIMDFEGSHITEEEKKQKELRQR